MAAYNAGFHSGGVGGYEGGGWEVDAGYEGGWEGGVAEEWDDTHSPSQSHSHLEHHAAPEHMDSQPVAVMHAQLVAEGLLPALLPASILSSEQLEALALKRRSLDQILTEVKEADVAAAGVMAVVMRKSPRHAHFVTSDSLPTSPMGGVIPPSIFTDPATTIDRTPKPSSPTANPLLTPKNRVSAVARGGNDQQAREARISGTDAVGLYGSVLRPEDHVRLADSSIVELEVERGETRHLLNTHDFTSPYTSAGAHSPKFKTLKTSGPLALKTRKNVDPSSPYGSVIEESNVRNMGIPAGAGLMLWRPRYRAVKGRVRAGQATAVLRAEQRQGPKRKPYMPLG
ncbi:hypothetical protein B484DRAFT_201453 [Ochromonadaceae sp. CCMP2298]|nr:hypothetical protein B484DRAFT_201453 [Ochromonadaceae sp. CCMP2298]